jgi:hypothetical protein
VLAGGDQSRTRSRSQVDAAITRWERGRAPGNTSSNVRGFLLLNRPLR